MEKGFTLRALLAGLLISVFITLSNTYYGLQIGVASQMSLVSVLLGYAGFKVASRWFAVPFTPAEHVFVVSVATASGCMPVTAGLIGVIPALEYLLGPDENGPLQLPWEGLLMWSIGLCFFGLIFASIFRQYFVVHSALLFAGAVAAKGCKTFPASMDEYSAGFKQPEPPLIKPEFTSSFVQHKWQVLTTVVLLFALTDIIPRDENVSNIAAGFITNSASKGFVQVDLAFDGQLASSVLNYANVTEEGLVDNTVTTLADNSTTLEVWQDYVNPNFPIFPEDILVQAGAVYSGLVERKFLTAPVAAWSIMYQGVIPTTVYVDNTGLMVGFDYFSPGLRTHVITEFFNTKAKKA